MDMESGSLREVDRVTGSEKSLGALLEQEYFLLKVLAYVMADGLHECRLTCRKWRDACRKLPVKLGRVPLERLSKAVDLFPEAKALSMNVWILNPDVLGMHMISHLLRLENLNHLSLFVYDQFIDLRYLVTCFSSMQHLRSLCLKISREGTLHCLIHDLHYLRTLTSLYLIHTCHLWNDLEPNSSVQGLSQLETGFKLLVNKRGELVFPKLTRLTSLDVYHRSNSDPRQFPPNLQVC